MSKCLPSPWDPGSQDINFVSFEFWIFVHFRPGRLNKNVIITWPALGLMGISGPSGVLMLPSGLRPLGSIKTPSGPEIPMIPRAGGVIMSHFPFPAGQPLWNPRLKDIKGCMTLGHSNWTIRSSHNQFFFK